MTDNKQSKRYIKLADLIKETNVEGLSMNIQVSNEDNFIGIFKNGDGILDITKINDNDKDDFFSNISTEGIVKLIPYLKGILTNNVKQSVLNNLIENRINIFNVNHLAQDFLNKSYIDKFYEDVNETIKSESLFLAPHINFNTLLQYILTTFSFSNKGEYLLKLGYKIDKLGYKKGKTMAFFINYNNEIFHDIECNIGSSECNTLLTLFYKQNIV